MGEDAPGIRRRGRRDHRTDDNVDPVLAVYVRRRDAHPAEQGRRPDFFALLGQRRRRPSSRCRNTRVGGRLISLIRGVADPRIGLYEKLEIRERDESIHTVSGALIAELVGLAEDSERPPRRSRGSPPPRGIPAPARYPVRRLVRSPCPRNTAHITKRPPLQRVGRTSHGRRRARRPYPWRRLLSCRRAPRSAGTKSSSGLGAVVWAWSISRMMCCSIGVSR